MPYGNVRAEMPEERLHVFRSLPFIGKKIGGRDHTTVLHGVRLVKSLIEAGDAETIAAVDQIIERLQVRGGAHD